MHERIKRYQTYNRNRKIKAVNFDKNQALFFFRVIPYLLHCNYPDLPGYIDDPECCFGIYRFLPDKYMDDELFNRYFPESTAREPNTPSPYPVRQPSIHSLKTIGSIGTIAQTTKSDCDYWVSIRHEELGGKSLELLEKKCRLIEQWAQEKGFEIYFFLMDIDQTKENRFDSSVDGESAGSALKILLKDELFRTHILVAGKMLLWWLVPPGLTIEEYRHFVTRESKSRRLNPDNFVDLGYFSDIPKSEIFGACLWQMNKALDSPYKSLIKFAYLELLLKEKSKLLPLFSTRIQCLVTYPQKLPEKEQELPLSLIDPYLLLAREIISFYRRQKRTSDAELIRECLFMKTLEGIHFRKSDKDLKQGVMLMKKWDILPRNYATLIKNEAWNYHDLLETGKRVHSFLLNTYKRLSLFQESFDSNATTISKRDIAILGKKLFTYYEKKEEKVPYLRSISRSVMKQEDITLHRNTQGGDSYYWAYQGKPFTKTIVNNEIKPIKEDQDLVRLLTSLVINGIIQKKTAIHITPYFKEIYLKDIEKLLEIMLEMFPLVNFGKIPAEEMLNPERVMKALIVINMEKLDVRGSKRLESSIVTLNNYGEHFYSFCTSLVQLKNKMRYFLTKYYVSRWNNNLSIFIPPQPQRHYISNLLEK